MMTITILKCMLLGWAISKFEPLQMILDAVKDSMIKYLLVVLTGCAKCCSFWVTTLYTGSFFDGALAFFLVASYSEITSNLKHLFIKKLNN